MYSAVVISVVTIAVMIEEFIVIKLVCFSVEAMELLVSDVLSCTVTSTVANLCVRLWEKNMSPLMTKQTN